MIDDESQTTEYLPVETIKKSRSYGILRALRLSAFTVNNRKDPLFHSCTPTEFRLRRETLLQWLGKKEATTKTTDTIFIYCYVCLCFIMSRWKEKREEEQKETDEGELHSNEGMPGAVGWGEDRWDPRMTLLLGDLYPLVEWPSSRGKIYRISESLS